MNIIVHNNGAVQFTSYLVLRDETSISPVIDNNDIIIDIIIKTKNHRDHY